MEKNIVAGHCDRQPYTQSLPTCYLVILFPCVGYISGVHLFVIYFNKFAYSYHSLCSKKYSTDVGRLVEAHDRVLVVEEGFVDVVRDED